MRSVQLELKLDAEQSEKARVLAKELRERWDEEKKKTANLPRMEHALKDLALADAQYDEGMKALEAFLKPEQINRFDQILFQRRGARAMLEPRMAEALKLTSDQKQQINRIAFLGRNELSKIYEPPAQNGDSIDLDAKVLANLKEFRLKAEEQLDPDQKKVWDQAAGPYFERAVGDWVVP